MWKFEFPSIRGNCGKTLGDHGNELCRVQIRKKNTYFIMLEKRKKSFSAKEKQPLMLKLRSSVDKCRCICPWVLHLWTVRRASWSRVEVGRMGPSNKLQTSLPTPQLQGHLESYSLNQNSNCHHPPDKALGESENPAGGWGGGAPTSISIKGPLVSWVGTLWSTAAGRREGALWKGGCQGS